MRMLSCPLVFLGTLVLGCSCTAAQPTVNQPRFEVASVKPSLEPALEATMPVPLETTPVRAAWAAYRPIPMPDPGRVSIRRISLLALVAMAYRVPMTQVRGPKWMADEVFEVEAKVPVGAGRDQVRQMLQSLVEERFNLVMHHEMSEVPGYALLVSKSGVKLTPGVPPAAAPAGQDRRANLLSALNRMTSAGEPRPADRSHYGFKGITTSQLAGILSPLAHAPVVDMTGLAGTYDVTLDISRSQAEDSIFDAVAKLGLKLASKRVPNDVVVIEKVSKTPVAN